MPTKPNHRPDADRDDAPPRRIPDFRRRLRTRLDQLRERAVGDPHPEGAAQNSNHHRRPERPSRR